LTLPAAFFFLLTHNYTYWIEPCTNPESQCQPGDPELADWAMRAWADTSAGALKLSKLSDPQHARFRLYWAGAREGLYGEARPIVVDGKRGAEVYVRPAPLNPRDPILRDAIVYLTCVHETGHALGLPHTANFVDIMYSFQYGGDIPEYFNRYRRRLKIRADIARTPPFSESDQSHLGELAKKP
jgi:hypothetical protein